MSTPSPLHQDQAIIITKVGPSYAVVIQPSDDEPQFFDEHKRAFGFASGLRMTTRLKIIDHTEGTRREGVAG